MKKNGQPIESYQNTNIFAAAKSILMQADKHPSEYRYVVFQDMTNGHKFLTRSCVTTTETVTWEEDGKDYPIYKLEISNKSHPFFTGKKMLVDTAGRIEKFNRKFRKAKK